MTDNRHRTLLLGVLMGALFGYAPGSVAGDPNENEAACQAWCAENPECAKCSPLVGCGVGFKNIKSWTGKGKNWYACAKR